MRDNILLTIIIPTFNSGLTIRNTLSSISKSTFRNIEVIISDCNSTDDTLEIIREFSLHCNIVFLSERDKGIYDAMNKGIQRANGRWLYFLGSDDYLLDESVLEKVSPFLDEEKYDFVYGDVMAPDYGGVYGGEFNRDRLDSENICHQAIFYHKSLFERLGLYSLKYPLLADYAFNLKCFYNNTLRIKYIPVAIAYYAPAGLSKVRVDEKFLVDKEKILFSLKYSSSSFLNKVRLAKQYMGKKIRGL